MLTGYTFFVTIYRPHGVIEEAQEVIMIPDLDRARKLALASAEEAYADEMVEIDISGYSPRYAPQED